MIEEDWKAERTHLKDRVVYLEELVQMLVRSHEQARVPLPPGAFKLPRSSRTGGAPVETRVSTTSEDIGQNVSVEDVKMASDWLHGVGYFSQGRMASLADLLSIARSKEREATIAKVRAALIACVLDVFTGMAGGR